MTVNVDYSECFGVVEIALDGIQVYSTCADSKIKQSLEEFVQEKVILIPEALTLTSRVRFLVFNMK